MKSPARLLRELQERNVFRALTLYCVTCWVLLQVAALVLPVFHAPEWALKGVIVAAVVGLPIVAALAWLYELKSHGLERDDGTGTEATTTSRAAAAHRVNVLIIAGLCVAVALLAIDDFVIANRDAGGRAHGTSLAVLPFESIGADSADAPLVDGIHDDIITQLAMIRSLAVISRTSVMRYRGSTKPLRQVGAELGAGSILRGDVQRSGERVRVNVQLLDAASDAHLWANSYDAALTAENVFDIQRRIATHVADALKIALLPQERQHLAGTPTSNLDALFAYQAGRQSMSARTQEGLQSAIASFEQAIALDSRFALAYASLAQANVNLLSLGTDSSELMPRAVWAAKHAIEIDPMLGEAYAVLGVVAGLSGNFDDAKASFERAVEVSPNSADVRYLYGHTLDEALGRADLALPQFERAQKLDPLSPVIVAYHGLCLATLGHIDEGLAQLAQARTLDPLAVYPYAFTGNVYWYGLARGADALEWYRRAATLDPDSASWMGTIGAIYMQLQNTTEAERWIDYALSLDPENTWASVYKSLILLLRGEDASAAQHAEIALRSSPRDEVAINVLRTLDVRAGRVDAAVERYRASFPELFADQAPAVELANLEAATDLALLLRMQHQDDQAKKLLDAGRAVWAAMPHRAMLEYPADVHILAVSGRDDEAIAALRRAVDAGWRDLWQFDLMENPNFDRIRDRPKFKAILEQLRRDMAAQGEQARAREARGEYQKVLPDTAG